MPTLIQHLNAACFWDVDITKLDEQKSKRLIIERIVQLGTLDEIKLIKEFYGVETIISTICQLNYIDPKTLNFLSLLFQTPKTKFKCYTRAQSTSQHWSY
ncbi:MAG: hypothetical protein KKF98_07860 [Bacteroidetes bacterium]|jgi:hypothetical protein|nr:hypothetical protein [Bacteroidota bacterium]